MADGSQYDIIAAWIAREILPHEGDVRNWLRRRWRTGIDVDDVIQEAYCRIAGLGSVDHIARGRSYFFRTAQAVAIDMMRHAKVANIVAVTEIEWMDVRDDEPLADRSAMAKQELEKVDGLLSRLSWTCRRVIELRRIEGLSQRETAAKLNVSESVVENHIVRGVRAVLKAIASEEAGAKEKEEGRIGTP